MLQLQRYVGMTYVCKEELARALYKWFSNVMKSLQNTICLIFHLPNVQQVLCLHGFTIYITRDTFICVMKSGHGIIYILIQLAILLYPVVDLLDSYFKLSSVRYIILTGKFGGRNFGKFMIICQSFLLPMFPPIATVQLTFATPGFQIIICYTGFF